MKPMRIFIFVPLFVFLAVGCGNPKKAEIFRKTAFIMGTVVNVTVVDHDEIEASLKMEEVFNEMRRIEKLMAMHAEGSDVYKVNAAAGEKAVGISPETLTVIREAQHVAPLTSGKFDITIGALTALWDLENNGKKMFIPPPEEVRAAKEGMGLDEVAVDEAAGSVFLKRKGMALDLGGIAKGYAVDRAVELLRQAGISGGIVDAGGDLRLFGRKPDGTIWRTGIQHPRDPNGILAVLELTDIAIITSGDYERYFVKDGIRYHHILDPATGYPAGDCQSVTIITHDTAYADALGTGVFILGPEKGMELINSREELEGIIVTSGGEVLVSKGLKGKVEIL